MRTEVISFLKNLKHRESKYFQDLELERDSFSFKGTRHIGDREVIKFNELNKEQLLDLFEF
jgi:hypothetical protein